MRRHDHIIKIMVTLFSLGALLISCDTEEDLEPSGIKSGYLVPQGNNDYDAVITDYYNRYGSNLLYEFKDKDAYWTPLGWDNGVAGPMDSIGKLGFSVTKADEDYLLQQLGLIEKTCFQYYDDTFMQAFLPVKVLLCSKVEVMNFDFSSWPFKIAGFPVAAYFHYDQLSVSHASDTIENMSHMDSITFALGLNRALIESMTVRELTSPTEEFSSSVDYNAVSSLYNNSEMWALGSFQPNYYATAQRDWGNFLMMMVSYSEDYLMREPASIIEWDYEETAWEGIFHETKDTNGLLKARYDIVRNYFIDNYGTDLQQIGNAMQ